MAVRIVALVSSLLIIALGCTHISKSPAPPRESPAPPHDRYEFAQALSKLHEGMPADEAKGLLGPPDDVRTQNDPDGLLGWVGTKQIWHYGTNGHLTFGTLGAVYIDEDNRVQRVFGLGCPPPPRGMFEEEELRRILRIIHQSPRPDGREFNPRNLIVAVNALQPLGKEKALAALMEYYRVTDNRDEAQSEFIILRALFDLPERGFMPPMFIGAPAPDEPKDPKKIPRFPLAIVDDVPFMLVDGYALAGMPQSPLEHLTYFREHGQLRAKKLFPSTHLLDVYDKVLAIANGLSERPMLGEQRMLAEQLLSLIDTVYRPSGIVRHQQRLALEDAGFQSGWSKRRNEIEHLNIRWSVDEIKYVFAKDGSALPDREFKNYFRQVVKLKPFGQSGEVSIQRTDDNNARFDIQIDTPVNSEIVVRLITSSPDHPETPQVAIELNEAPTGNSQQRTEPRGDLKVANPSNPALGLSHGSAWSSSVGNDFRAGEWRSCGVELREGYSAVLQLQIGNKTTNTGPWVP